MAGPWNDYSPHGRRLPHQWGRNVYAKALRDLEEFLNLWDVSADRDTIALQEIVGDDGKSDSNEVRVLRRQGRGSHIVVLSRVRPGAHRVEVVVHRRWAAHIESTAFAPGGRTVAVTFRVGHRRVQSVSAHLPSAMRRTCDEYVYRMAELTSLLRGRRRHWLLLGIDTNIRSHQVQAGICAAALRTASSQSTQKRINMDTLIAEMIGHGIKIMNTFESWWKQHFMRESCRGTSRATW